VGVSRQVVKAPLEVCGNSVAMEGCADSVVFCK
jgi:hypothetical protein